jgi:hypothetical protein
VTEQVFLNESIKNDKLPSSIEKRTKSAVLTRKILTYLKVVEVFQGCVVPSK